MITRDSTPRRANVDEFHARQHLLDGLAQPSVGYLAHAAAIGGQDSRFVASPQLVSVCVAVTQLSNAVDVERGLINEYWDQGCRDVPLELKAARAAVKHATRRYLTALHRAMFSSGGFGVRHVGEFPSTLRSAAGFADLILDRVERNKRGEPTYTEYKVRLESATCRVHDLFALLLRALVLDFVMACAQGTGGISDEVHGLISLWGRLGIALQAERSRFEDEGVGPELLELLALRASLQTETAAALRGYFEHWAFMPVRDKRTAALLRCMAGDPDKIGMMILSAVCGDSNQEADETLREFLSMRDTARKEREAREAYQRRQA
jgi:hypothetical protein